MSRISCGEVRLNKQIALLATAVPQPDVTHLLSLGRSRAAGRVLNRRQAAIHSHLQSRRQHWTARAAKVPDRYSCQGRCIRRSSVLGS